MTMTTFYMTRLEHYSPGPHGAEAVCAFETEEERSRFLTSARKAGWRPQSISDVVVYTAAQGIDLLAAKLLLPPKQ